MTTEFLDSLKGLPLAKAEQVVLNKGLKFYPVHEHSPVVAAAYHKTVLLVYNDNDVVTAALAGDPLEME
jgi:hypothetical protein